MMPKVEVLSRRRLLDDVFKVDEATVRFERFDGSMSEPVRRLVFERGDAAAVLLIHAERRSVLLARQFRYPAFEKGGGWLLDLVAGGIEAGEAPEQAARRETFEEAGFALETIEPIATFFVSPGGTSERIFLFGAAVADRARTGAGGGLAAEHEDIELVEKPIDEFLAEVRNGAIQDAKTLIAGYWLKDNLARLLQT
jgi:nudix-type nucleoside diphosphatase (YffH/AdpP family)